MCKRNFIAKVRKALAAMAASALVLTTVWNGIGGIVPVHAEEEAAKGRLNVTYHTQAEISARVKSDGVKPYDASPEFVVDPLLTPPYDNAGVLSQGTLDSALKMMNQVRYIAGLQDVTLNEEYNKMAQAAALVSYANGGLSHNPSRPAGMSDSMYDLGYRGASSSNLSMVYGKGSLNEMITLLWMQDGGSNIDRVGHRRWILNPSMGQTGFGAVYGSYSTYSAMYAFNEGNSSAWETQVAWPAQNMPVQFFNSVFPWSISMGTYVDKNAVHVTLRRVGDGMTWNFSSGSSNGYFNVNNDSYGQSGCIIFRPDIAGGYHAGDTFEVSITGSGINLSYTVNFFDPNDVQPEERILETDWAAADALLDTVPDGGAADILTGSRFTVPAETLSKIAGRNILCAFHIDSDLVFSMEGTNVQPATAPWNVAVSYKTRIPAAQLAQLKNNAAAMRTFDLSASGAFPAPVNVHIVWGTENAGKQAILYSYDDATGALSEQERFVITDGGQSMFTIAVNGGQYAVVVTN